MNSNLPVFFILCKGRSGSTLLQMLLNGHPQVQVPLESRFFIYLHQKYASKTSWTAKDLNQFYKDLFLDDRFREFWKADRVQLQKALEKEPANTTFARLYKIVCLYHEFEKTKVDIQLIGDKNPVNCLFIPEIKRAFPKAKFIHLVRDPRDVCLSQITNFSIESLAIAAQKWKLFNKTVERHKAQDPSGFFTLRYEDLVKNPEKSIKEICSFLEIDFRENMIDTNKRNRDYSQIDEALEIEKKHGNVNKPISTKSIGKWQKNFTAEQVKKVEGIVKPLMKRYQYEPTFAETQPATLTEKLYFRFKMARLKAYYKSPVSLRKFYRKLLGISSNFAGK